MDERLKIADLDEIIPDNINAVFSGYLRTFINKYKAKDKIDNITYDLEGVKAVRYDKERGTYNKDQADDRYYKLSEELERAKKDYKLNSMILKHLNSIYNNLEDGEVKDAIKKRYIEITEF